MTEPPWSIHAGNPFGWKSVATSISGEKHKTNLENRISAARNMLGIF
jgi:hypothetical protein